MKLRLKVLLILSTMWLIISLAIFIYGKSTLTNEYAKLETQEVVDNLDRVNKTIMSLFASLKLTSYDWSQWNDSYQFMKDKNKTFISTNLTDTTFENIKINLILFFDTSGKLFYGLNFNLETKRFVTIPLDLLDRLSKENTFSRQVNINSNKIGILKIKEGYAILSSVPILTSEGKGPIAGTLVMGYFLNDQHLAQIADMVKTQVHLFTLPIPAGHPKLMTAYHQLQTGIPNYIIPQNENVINGYTFIQDIDKHPIGMLRIQIPRLLFLEGVATIDRYLAIVISAGAIFLLALWYLLKKVVLDRLISTNNQLMTLNAECNFTKRIHVSGNDELNEMIGTVNSLLEIIELTEEQLKHRLFIRTEELERLTSFNKNLFHEMHHQKAVETELRNTEKMLRQIAYYDALTGLPNRLFFEEILEKIILQSAQDKTEFAIMFLDADQFKSINDTFGHDVGDKFLQHSAEQLLYALKNCDLAARLAGDEFIICLSNVNNKALIRKMAESILQKLSIPLKIGAHEVHSDFSMGISLYPTDGKTVAELEKNADLAMYYAKKRQHSAYYFFDEIEKKIPTE